MPVDGDVPPLQIDWARSVPLMQKMLRVAKQHYNFVWTITFEVLVYSAHTRFWLDEIIQKILQNQNLLNDFVHITTGHKAVRCKNPTPLPVFGTSNFARTWKENLRDFRRKM